MRPLPPKEWKSIDVREKRTLLQLPRASLKVASALEAAKAAGVDAPLVAAGESALRRLLASARGNSPAER